MCRRAWDPWLCLETTLSVTCTNKHDNTKIDHDDHSHKVNDATHPENIQGYYRAVQIDTARWTDNKTHNNLDIDIVGRIFRRHFYASRPAMAAARWIPAR